MKRQHKAQRIQQILDEHFAEPPIPLRHEDPFTLLIAVLLSAQCTDVRVNQVTPVLFARARTAASMRRLPAATIRSIIRPCGLSPQKSKAIRELSRMLVAEHGGQVPASPAFPVDTHIHRLAWRWGLSRGTSVEQTERDLVRTFPREHWNKLHLQLIHFGRAFCKARQHVPATCPICSWAMSRTRRNEEARQRRQPKADRNSAHGSRARTQR
jgi:endonuclease-3